jgi:hypothetical protein
MKQTRGNLVVRVVVAVLCLSCVQTLYFHIGETERKCFIEEIPDDTLVIGKYKIEMFDVNKNAYQSTTPGIGMQVEVKDPNSKILLSKLYTSEGRFSFTSHMPGEHVICLHSNSSAWFTGQKLVRTQSCHVSCLFRHCSVFSVFISILILANMPSIINR